MKKNCFFKPVLSLCLMAMCWLSVNAQDATMRGDLNGDGKVAISDVTALINYLLSDGGSTIDAAAADLNGDGKVSIADVTTLINYLLSGEWPFNVQSETFTVSGVSFTMIPVQGGTYMMGGGDNDSYARPWEKPVHEVTLDAFYICEIEVTQELWKAVMGSNPSWFQSSNGSYGNDLTRPVESVAFTDCLTFITKLNQKTGKTFRLPTEAEWEFAARGGVKSMGYLYAGSDNIEDVAWHKGNSGDIPHSVATKAPNELGLYDMSGNIEEWCSDWYDLYSTDAQTNPTGPTTGTTRVARGGCWDQAWRMSRSTSRNNITPSVTNIHTGLRLAMSL